MKRILMIDDEPVFVEPYLVSLREHFCPEFQVDLEEHIETALEYVCQHSSELACIILDMMLIWGRPNPEKDQVRECEGYFWAGFYVLKKIRESAPGAPVVILTNQKTKAVEERLSRRNWSVAAICDKTKTLPFEFIEVVEGVVKKEGRA